MNAFLNGDLLKEKKKVQWYGQACNVCRNDPACYSPIGKPEMASWT